MKGGGKTVGKTRRYRYSDILSEIKEFKMKHRDFWGRLVLWLIFLGFWGWCGVLDVSCQRQFHKGRQVMSFPGGSYRDLTSDGAWCWFADPRA